MKIAVFIPCLSRKSAGGAETYLLGIADMLSKTNDVTVFTLRNFTPGFNINKIYSKYGVDSIKTKYLYYLPVGLRHPYIRILSCFWLSCIAKFIDGKYDLFVNDNKTMLIAPHKTKSIHVIHFPEEPLTKTMNTVLTRKFDAKYLKSYSVLLPNSEFTNYWLKKFWGVQGTRVLNPIINISEIDTAMIDKKDNLILAVDRLVPDKKIIEMIQAFKELLNLGIRNYTFLIIGNEDAKYSSYKEEIEHAIENYPINVMIGASNEELCHYYEKAKIFWHAKGLGVDESKPYEMEHFGMTTVEAMANGCVPIVIDKGGQREIVDHGVDGFRWNTLEELVTYTKNIILAPKMLHDLQIAAVDKSKIYSKKQFAEKISTVIKEVI